MSSMLGMPMRRKSKPDRDSVRSRRMRRTKAGNVVKPFAITDAQWAALRREAFKRAAASGFGRPDASAVLRQILDAWMTKAGKH